MGVQMTNVNKASPRWFHKRVVVVVVVAIDCKDSASRGSSLSSASEAKGCAFLLISLLNPGFLTGSSPDGSRE